MKITVFTNNQPRHLNLINELSKISDECYAIVESNTIFPGKVSDLYSNSELFQEYFTNVRRSENKIFGDVQFIKNVHSLVLKSGDLSFVDRCILDSALNSDIYIVFGSSYIKGWLIDFLLEKKAINIHMGISPYYRGTGCNFWSLYDLNPHLCGATVHRLSKGLDSGDILYHVAPSLKDCNSLYDFTMTSVKSAHLSLVNNIKNKTINDYKPIKQNKSLEIRYSRNKDFTDEIIKNFYKKQLTIMQVHDLIEKKNNSIELIKPFYFK